MRDITLGEAKMTAQNMQGMAVVTGAGQGIGRAIALRLLANGNPIVAIGRTEEKLVTLHKEAGVSATMVRVLALDIRDVAKLDQSWH